MKLLYPCIELLHPSINVSYHGIELLHPSIELLDSSTEGLYPKRKRKPNALYCFIFEGMKYHILSITTDSTEETYNRISNLLGLEPKAVDKNTKDDSLYSLWEYEVITNEEDEYFNFINNFLDILNPKLIDLEKLGVIKENILFWLLYEYNQQCAMEFNPQEIKRLGESGIHLNY